MFVEQHYCKACGVEFRLSRDWQVFCSTKCKKDLEKIYSDYNSAIRPHMIECAEKIARLRN